MMKSASLTAAVALACFMFAPGCEQQFDQYQKGSAKAKQIEAKLGLTSLATAQMAYRAANRSYGKTFDEIGFGMVEENQRYTYFMGEDILEGARYTDELPDFLKPPEVTDSSFTAYAVANLDDDPDLDVWSVNQSGITKHIRDDR